MTVRLGLLAILDQGACYGYQLRSELDRRTGGTGPVNVGQVYNTLDRLERDRLVHKTSDSNYYEITDAGRRAVTEWFGTPSGWTDLPAKIALASTLPGVDASAIVRTQRAFTTDALEILASPETAEDSTAAIIVAARIESATAELRFLDAAERMLASGAEPRPLNSDVPKRGRPAKPGA